MHGERELSVAAADIDLHGTLRRAVGERVAGQVGDQLRHPIPVEVRARLSLDRDLDAAARMRGLELGDDLPDDVGEIGGLPGDRDSAPLAAAHEIEQVADHPLHPVGGVRDATHGARRAGGASP